VVGLSSEKLEAAAAYLKSHGGMTLALSRLMEREKSIEHNFEPELLHPR
jgi:hypothetical protein